jgi:hypothetical protein
LQNNRDIAPTDTYLIGTLAFGEGWHNFHHVYPYDYKVSELPRYWCNFTIPFIDFFAYIGWAYELKTVSDETIRKRVLRTGDGSHRYSEKLDINGNQNPPRDVDHFWGYGTLSTFNFHQNIFKCIEISDDKDLLAEDKKGINILCQKVTTEKRK